MVTIVEGNILINLQSWGLPYGLKNVADVSFSDLCGPETEPLSGIKFVDPPPITFRIVAEDDSLSEPAGDYIG
jgi:hypothetical protein